MVAAVGEGVTHVKAGDHVMAFTGWGGFAEQAVADAMRVSPMPPTMSFAQGASFMLTYATSHHALKDDSEAAGGRNAADPRRLRRRGTSAIQLAKITGATVIAAASSDDKLALLQVARCGSSRQLQPRRLARDQLNAIVGKKGVDVLRRRWWPLRRTGPAFAGLAWTLSGSWVLRRATFRKFPLNLALLKERQILGVYWGDSVAANPKGHLANMRELGEWFAAGKIAPASPSRLALMAPRRTDAHGITAGDGQIVVTP